MYICVYIYLQIFSLVMINFDFHGISNTKYKYRISFQYNQNMSSQFWKANITSIAIIRLSDIAMNLNNSIYNLEIKAQILIRY